MLKTLTRLYNIFSASITLNSFTPENIPGINKHNSFQRYMYIKIPNTKISKIRRLQVHCYKTSYGVAPERASVRCEGKKFIFEITQKNQVFEVERNDCELTGTEYYFGSISELKIPSEDRDVLLKNSDEINFSGNKILLMPIEWYNWYRQGKGTDIFFKILLTDGDNRSHKSKYFEALNSLEIRVNSKGEEEIVEYKFPLSQTQIDTFEYKIKFLENQSAGDAFIDNKEKDWKGSIDIKKKRIFREVFWLIICIAIPLGSVIFLNRKTADNEQEPENEAVTV